MTSVPMEAPTSPSVKILDTPVIAVPSIMIAITYQVMG